MRCAKCLHAQATKHQTPRSQSETRPPPQQHSRSCHCARPIEMSSAATAGHCCIRSQPTFQMRRARRNLQQLSALFARSPTFIHAATAPRISRLDLKRARHGEHPSLVALRADERSHSAATACTKCRLFSSLVPSARVASREELSVWMCEAHNRVNRLLGKPEFPCLLKDLDARWRTGGPHCDYSDIADDEQEIRR